jgi:glycosyltransferase involved in cell wall biosynthesis
MGRMDHEPNQTPLVSVVIPTHNRANLIGRAISSALAQDYENLEILVIDDGSTDNTPDVVSGYDSVRYVRLDTNRGGSAARNHGIRIAKGELVAFLDSDDEWLPTKVSRQVALMLSSPETGAVYCRHFSEYEATGHRFEEFPPIYRGAIRSVLLSGRCPRTVSLFLVRRDALIGVGGFDEELAGFQDTDLWIRLSENWEFNAVDEALAIVYEHPGDRVTTDPAVRARALDSFLGKWGSEMAKEIGVEGVADYRRRHLAVAQGALVLRKISQGRRRQAVPELVRYFRDAGWSNPRQGVGLLVAMVGGIPLHNRLKAALKRIRAA